VCVIAEQNLKREDRNEVDDEPAAKVTNCNLFVVADQLLLLHVPEALEKRQKEVHVEETFDGPVDDLPLKRILLDGKRYGQYTVNAGVCNE